MPGDARREAERPPWFAVIGTITLAPLFAGSVIVLGPYLLSGWKLDPPFFGWAPSRWIGGVLVIFPIPPLFDFLVRFGREGHGTPAPFAPPRHLVVTGPFRYVRNPAYLCAASMIVGQGLFLGSTRVLVYAAVVALELLPERGGDYATGREAAHDSLVLGRALAEFPGEDVVSDVEHGLAASSSPRSASHWRW